MNKLILIAFLIFSPFAGSQNCTTIKANGPIGWVPIVYRDANHNLTGIAVDVAKKISNSLNVDLEIQPHIPWKRQLKKLQKGSLDMLVAAYISEERERLYKFSMPFLEEKVKVFTHYERQFNFNQWEDLTGKLGLRPRGGTYGSEFDRFAKEKLEFIEFSDKQKSLDLLYSGRADYLVLAFNDGLLSAKKFGYENKIVALEKTIVEISVHFLISKNSPCKNLIDKINTELTTITRNEELKHIQQKFDWIDL